MRFSTSSTCTTTGDIIEVSGDGTLNVETGMIEFRPLQELVENATYTWKVTAIDIPPGEESEPGEIWSFTVNTENSPPDLPHFISPEENETVKTLRPTLKVAGGTRDLDSESLSIVFRVWYTDEDGVMTGDAPLVESEPVPVDAEGTASWTLPLDLEENVHFIAECYATDGPGEDGLRDAALLRLRHGRGPADAQPGRAARRDPGLAVERVHGLGGRRRSRGPDRSSTSRPTACRSPRATPGARTPSSCSTAASASPMRCTVRPTCGTWSRWTPPGTRAGPPWSGRSWWTISARARRAAAVAAPTAAAAGPSGPPRRAARGGC
jgi:hypothetical protein